MTSDSAGQRTGHRLHAGQAPGDGLVLYSELEPQGLRGSLQAKTDCVCTENLGRKRG